jgi:hypothetical protein
LIRQMNPTLIANGRLAGTDEPYRDQGGSLGQTSPTVITNGRLAGTGEPYLNHSCELLV